MMRSFDGSLNVEQLELFRTLADNASRRLAELENDVARAKFELVGATLAIEKALEAYSKEWFRWKTKRIPRRDRPVDVVFATGGKTFDARVVEISARCSKRANAICYMKTSAGKWGKTLMYVEIPCNMSLLKQGLVKPTKK